MSWFQTFIQRVKEYVDENSERGRDVWFGSEKVIDYVARNDPSSLLELVSVLVELWMKGACIGSPKAIFESYKEIKDEKTREEVKKQFQSLYSQMEAVNPKLEKVDWTL